MEDSKLFVDLKPLTDEEINSKNFGLDDLWMVKVTGKDPYGPYDTQSLKDYADKYEFLFENAKVYNLETDEWSDMFALAHFQRRKPQLVSAQNLIKTQEFYILFNGQKDGPHSQDKVQQLLDEGHILSSTQISLDKGQSWIKLYEHHAFDRRTKKSNQELPFKPNDAILKKVQNKKAQIIKLKEAQDAIVEFAYMGIQEGDFSYDGEANLELETNPSITLNRKIQAKEVAQLKKLKKSKKLSKDSSSKSYVKVFASICIVFAAVGLIFLQQSQDKQSATPQMTKTKSSEKSIDNSERQNFKKIKKIKRMPASVKRKSSVINRIKKKKAPRRIQRRPQRRYVQKEAPELKEVFEKDIENIDIDDPEIKEELSRQLAGEYENEEDHEDEREERDEREDENPYAVPADEEPVDDYPEEEPVSHEDY